jgi:sugar phosphate isomerase/epimerase
MILWREIKARETDINLDDTAKRFKAEDTKIAVPDIQTLSGKKSKFSKITVPGSSYRTHLKCFQVDHSFMFGISTFCLHEEPLTTALDRISGISDHIEIMDEGLHYLENSEPLLSYSTHFSIHAPCRGTNIASLLEPIRRASVEVIEQCFLIAAEVNARVIVHPGYFAWAEERTKAERQLVTSTAELTSLANEYSVSYFIENMGNWDYFFLKTPDELPLIGDTPFALDVGHAHLNFCLSEFLRLPAGHYHLHDNNGKEDSHVAVGEGTIDFDPVMKSIQKNKVIPVIEVATFDGVLKSIQTLNMLSTL